MGSSITHTVNIRVVAAINRNLKQEVSKGAFREDLYYRLSMVEINLPRLVERKEDLALLECHLLSKFCAEYIRKLRASHNAHKPDWPDIPGPGTYVNLKTSSATLA